MSNKRKTTTAIVAGVAAAALLLGGTLAWTSISQQAKNEASGIVNVGGRLHDDYTRMTDSIAVLFDTGDSSIDYNKDVYVENFTDPLNGGQPIYARIRLDEYMEIGSEAGKLDENGNYDASRNAKSVVANAAIDDPGSWSTHVPSTACEICENGEACLFHEHWNWTMGGQTVYMPTFNKDKDSLEADVNGTYQGVVVGDNVYFDDYIVYTPDENGAAFTEGTDTLPVNKAVYQKTATAYYDDDTDEEPNKTEGHYRTATETHTAKETSGGTVMMMDQWVTGGKNPGNYWVYDTDGWAYWANPIMPGEATGMFLDGIKMVKNPGEKCYYAINVVAQFATEGDWEYFENKDGTVVGLPADSDAMKVMKAASGNVPVVTVDGDNYLNVGNTYSFTATASRGEVSGAAAGDFEWYVTDENGKTVDSSVAVVTETENGADVKVSETVPDGTTLIVAAHCTDSAYLGATGSAPIVVRNLDALVPTVDITVDAKEVSNISAISLKADVMHNLAAYEGADIAWSITDENDTAVSEDVATVKDGVLKITQKEGDVKLKITASVTLSGNTTKETKDFEINASDYCDTCGNPYGDNGFCSDDDCTSGQYEPAVLSEVGETYEVANGGQLFYMANKINADAVNEYSFTLTEDIDLENRQWTPIGNSTNKFNGTFDGSGKSIDNFTVMAKSDNQGLIGVSESATITNFKISGKMELHLDSLSTGFGVIGVADKDSIISDIYSDVDFVVAENSAKAAKYLGGIVGYVTGDSSYTCNVMIQNCTFAGSIDGKMVTAGGIVGHGMWKQKFTLQNCLFVGQITSSQSDVEYLNSVNLKTEYDVEGITIGGIIGYHNAASGAATVIQKCLSYGKISIAVSQITFPGGIAGTLRGSDTCSLSSLYYCMTEGSNEMDGYGALTASDRQDSETEVNIVTVEEIQNRTVLVYLNGDSGTVWTQGANDAYPRPNQWS